LLPSVYEKILSELSDKGQIARTICDYISAMSDGFAIRTYKRLMDPDYGSIIDFV
jgi:dGTPase